MSTRNSIVRGLSAALVVAVLAACAESPESLLKSAKDYLAKGDEKAAVIQLRSALQKNTELAEARYLLGRALIDTGDITAAEKELRKALELKYPVDQVVPTLVRAMVAGGQYKKAIDEFGGTSAATPQGIAELKAALGQAYMAMRNAEAGKAAFDAALAAQPDYAPAILGVARMKAASGDLPGAVASIDAALAKNPNFAEGWLFKGDLAMAERQTGGALEAYRKAVEKKPDFVAAHAALVIVLLRDGKAEEATSQFAAMKRVAPNDPQTLYLQAVLAYDRKDFAAARDAIQLQLKAAPNNLQGLLLSGAVHYELQSYATAEANLSKVLNASPGHLFARRMLIATYLRSGQPDKALETLKPVLGVVDKDPALAAVAGEVYLRNGQPSEAARYFTRTVALDPQSSGGRVGLAISHLATGQADTAFQELESAAAESSEAQADLILIRAALARREFDKALAAIDALDKKQPNTALARNLRGGALLGKGDRAGARKQFEQALAIDPAFFPAAGNLARLDLADKKPDDAKKRFDSVLAKDPKNVSALLAIAELRARGGGSAGEVGMLIEKAIAANPTAVLPRLVMISHLLRTGDAKKAVAAGQDALAAMPDRPEILQALGRAHLAAGDTNQALANYNKLVQLQPNSPVPLLLVAQAQVAGNDKGAALQTLRKALVLKPDYVEAQRGIVTLELDAGRISQAVATARQVQKQRPKESVGYILEGDVYASKKSWSEAASAYRGGLRQVGTVDLATKLHAALVAGGDTKDAEQFATSWLKDHPKEIAFRIHLAQSALGKNDYAAAARQYQALVAMAPNNAILLNDLAWSAGQAKDPKAIEYAEKANRLAPDQPAIMDTLGVLLVEKGDTVRGVDLLQRAVKLAPSVPSIRLNLAKALIRTGQKDAAKRELEELAKLGDKFKSQADVEQLMKGL